MTNATAVLPIRSNSKRILRKNFTSFLGIPLYAIALSQIVSSKKFEKVILAVDKEEKIPANIIDDPDVTVYFRNPINSSDKSSAEDLLLEILEYESISKSDYIFLFQATNPFIRRSYINEAFEKIQDADTDSIITSIKSKRFFLDEVIKPNFSREMTQLRQYYNLETGLFWGVRVDSLTKRKKRIGLKPSIMRSIGMMILILTKKMT